MLASLAVLPAAPVAANGWDRLGTALLEPVAVENQLPNGSIPMALASDPGGFLWVGTQNGLSRWDGLRFQTFLAGTAPDTLPDSQIDTLHVDKGGRLWVGTYTAGLARYDPASGRFRRYPGLGGRRGGDAGVHALADAPAGRLWVASEGGLVELDPGSGAMVRAAIPPFLHAAFSSGVGALASDAGGLWIGTGKGLLRRDARSGALTAVRLTSGAQPQVATLMVDAAGRLWAGTDGAGAFVVDRAGGRVRAVPASLHAGLVGAGMRVRALLQVSAGEVWLGTYDNGVLAVDPADLSSRRLRLGNGSLLYADQDIRALHRAPDGQIFMASNSAITRYEPGHPAFRTLMGGQAPTAVLAERTPVSVGADAHGRVWVGFINHGVDVVDPATGALVHHAPRPGGLAEAPVRHFAADGEAMLLATDVGLFRSDLAGRRVERLQLPGRAADAPATTLLRDGDQLWLGGPDGLWRYHRLAGGRLAGGPVLASGRLSDRRVQVLARDPQGSIWIGTSKGLDVLEPRTGRLSVVGARGAAAPAGFISSITIDCRGRLWVATFGRGVFVAGSTQEARAGRFRRLDLAEGLPNSNADTVLEDSSGFMWVSTDSGLARIDPRTLRVQAVGLRQGVPVVSFFYDAGLRSSDGDILFAGRGGLQVVHPDLFRAPPVRPPPLRVTGVRQHGRELAGDPFQALAPGRDLHLPPGGGGFEVSFAALDYGSSARIHYAYRLGGGAGAGGWTEVDPSRPMASFARLDPGRYRLDIRARDEAREWPDQVLHLPLAVAPAWNQTWWFKALEALGAAAGICLLMIWRTRSLARRHRELETTVEQRTHALRVQNEVIAERTRALETQTHALQTQACQLAEARTRAELLAKAKSDFLTNMSHEIRTPLNGVVAVADLLARAALPEKERGMAEVIRASGDTLQRLLSDILDMARIESGKIAIETAPFHVGDMARAVAGLCQLKCEEKGVRLSVVVTAEADQSVLGDMVRVRQIVTNLLSNAVKFTDRGEIRLVVGRPAGGGLRIEVQDTGVGFSMADKAKVLSRFEQADSSITRRFGGTGLGLSICCNLAELMGGGLDCESEVGVGSRFWVELPLESAQEPSVVALATGAACEMVEGERLLVLVADDHPTNRQVLRLMLEEHAVITFAEDGSQAVEAYGEGRFDVVLMDMQMPVMDGLAATRTVRALEAAERRARTPLIMLTANALPEHVSAAKAAGADLHLAKPITASALFAALEDVLAERERDELAA